VNDHFTSLAALAVEVLELLFPAFYTLSCIYYSIF
jgi:hypothetical protein